MSLRDYYIDLERKDLEDPVISIAAGIRWISYKYSSLPKSAKRVLLIHLGITTAIEMGKNMLRKFLICIMILLEVTIASDEVTRRFDKAQGTRRQYLKLPSQDEIIISYHPNHGDHGTYKIRLFIRRNGIVVWDKTFSEDFNELWTRASFMPVIKDLYFFDLNSDGDLEIAVVVSHGGNAVWNTPAIIFTVKGMGLEFLKKQQVNDEFSEYVYSSEGDFENPKYKCSFCDEPEYYYADGKKAPLSDPRHKISISEDERMVQKVPRYLLRK